MAKNKRPGKPQGMNLAQTKAWEKQVFDALVELKQRIPVVFDDIEVMDNGQA